jgi:predicted short-subunit dehydrogenase-like oxidoreductase (DUF2520 family)
MSAEVRTVEVVGTGQAGRAMARVLARAGYAVRVVSRSAERAREAAAFAGAGAWGAEPGRADLVLLAVPDARIVEAAARARGGIVAHLSGAVPSAAIGAVAGARTGALHPLRSFADPAAAADAFAGTWCAVEGEAAEELAAVVRRIGGIPLRVRTDRKASYHAGAVFASNYLVAILEAALRLFEEAGVPRSEALAPILVLARGTIENVSRIGIPAALSGPVERGDAGTVARHVDALRRSSPGLLDAYAALARLACEIAVEKKSIGPAEAGAVNAALGGSSTVGVRL